MTLVDRANKIDVARFYGGIKIEKTWFGYAARKGRLVQSLGGALEESEGVWRAFLDMPAHMRTPLAMRYALRVLNECKERGADVVRATCDLDIPRADVFLERIGFVKTDDVEDGSEVWVWRA